MSLLSLQSFPGHPVRGHSWTVSGRAGRVPGRPGAVSGPELGERALLLQGGKTHGHLQCHDTKGRPRRTARRRGEHHSLEVRALTASFFPLQMILSDILRFLFVYVVFLFGFSAGMSPSGIQKELRFLTSLLRSTLI